MSWICLEQALLVSQAEHSLPVRPGKYAFFCENLNDLPPLFLREAKSRPFPQLLYIGKADVSLKQRVWFEECQHRRPGTFFRSVGAMLGYCSPDGGKNYRFAADDQARLIRWIANKLRVAWSVEAVDGSHAASERNLIARYAPLLNLQNNPKKFDELERLRAKCRAGQA
jgi:hypothetical protein